MAQLGLYSRELFCQYGGRKYQVRDNGAIYRHSVNGKPSNKWDETWTFGRFDPHSGYMLIGAERVHRIVCTAFHGEPVGNRNIVDHIDNNRCNNRPDNLHWVSKLENTLNNPITRAKVELICGSIENFLKNPKLLSGHESKDPNFSWMRNTSPEEAENSLKHWNEWAAKPLEERKPKGLGVGEWIYEKDKTTVTPKPSNRPRYVGPYNSWSDHKTAIDEANQLWYEQEYGCKDSLTPGAKQLNWKSHTKFLLCPGEGQERSLLAYSNNLVVGKAFSKSKYKDGDAVYKTGFNRADNAIIVLTHNQKIDDLGHGKPWSVCRITLTDGYFIHESLGSFFDPNGGEREFTEAMGGTWTGGKVLDDYC